METETVLIVDLKPPTRNVRFHPEQQIIELGRAVEKFGQTRPVVIDEDNTVLAGNGLVDACRRIGRTEVTVYRMTGLSAADKKKLMLSDNRIYSLGLDDHGAILDTIRGLEGDLDIPGFDFDVLKNLTMDTSVVTETAMSNYGKLSDAAIAGARGRTIAPPEAGSGDTRETAAGHVTCPSCGHEFKP